MKQTVLRWLLKELKKTRIDKGHAEARRGGVTECRNLRKKIAILEWLTDVVLNYEEKEEDPHE